MSVNDLPATSQRVRGHALMSAGDPYNDRGQWVVWGPAWVPDGRTKCECGWLSDRLTTNRDRKQAHRVHKADVLAGRTA